MRLKIIKIENQLVLPLPEVVIDDLDLSEGSEVEVTVEGDGKWILISNSPDSEDLNAVNEELGEMVDDVIDEFKTAFDKLADEFSESSSE